MKHSKKIMSRIIALLLAAAMVVTSAPQAMFSVSAAETDAGSAELKASAEDAIVVDKSENDDIAGQEGVKDNFGQDVDEGTQDGEDAGAKTDSADADGEDKAASGDEASDADKTKPGDESSDADKAESGDELTDADKTESGDELTDADKTEPEDELPDADKTESEEELLDADKLDYEEVLLDGETDEPESVIVNFSGYGEYTVYDADRSDITGGSLTVPYGSSDVTFSIVPNAGYTIILGKEGGIDKQCAMLGVQLSRDRVGDEYRFTLSINDKPDEGTDGYYRGIDFYIMTVRKASYNLKFVYEDADVEELVLANSLDAAWQQVGNNVSIPITNDYDTVFKFKAKAGKSLAVSYVPEDADGDLDVYGSYYVEDEDGYYNFDLGRVAENATITIQEGWRINFEYDATEIDELHRAACAGDAEAGEDLGDVEFNWLNTIGNMDVVAKGDTYYFDFYVIEDYGLCDVVVTDGQGNVCEPEIYGYNEISEIYKLVPTADMTIKIECVPSTLPVSYVEGVVSDISIVNADDGSECYDAANKEMTNIYNTMQEYNLSFKVAEGKQFDSAEIVTVYTSYDDDIGEWVNEYYYSKLNIEKQDDGTYASAETFCLEYDAVEIRIIADDACTVVFEEPANGISLYYGDDGKEPNIENEIAAGEPQIVVKGAEFEFWIVCNSVGELSTMKAYAESGGVKRELDVYRSGWGYDGEPASYRCSVIPTADTTVSVVLESKSIPFNYDKSALKNVETDGQGGAVLSEDKSSVNINNYEDLNDCVITFELEDNKTLIGAYYAYTGQVIDENGEFSKGVATYKMAIPVMHDEGNPLYSIDLNSIPWVDGNRVISIDYIQISAGDSCQISFEGLEGKGGIIGFNDYNDVELDTAQPIEAAKNTEYMFKVVPGDNYSAALCRITTDSGEELPIKYYTEQGMRETIPYYSFIPTEDNSTLHVDFSPLTIPVKYTDSAVKSLKFTYESEPETEETQYLPSFSADRKTINIWRYNDMLSFVLELESGSTLSRVFCRRFNVDDYGNREDGYWEDEIQFSEELETGKYSFDINPALNFFNDLHDIEIVTDKVNLNDCEVELNLDKDENGAYYAAYEAKKIEPVVTVKYGGDENKTLEPDEYTVTYKNNQNVGEAFVTVTAKEDSSCTGSISRTFSIVKAQAPTIAPLNISVDVNDTREDRELNLSNIITVNTDLGEEGLKPIAYTLDTGDADYKNGGVLADGTPVIERREFWYNGGSIWLPILKYSISSDANAASDSAVIVLKAEFDNYEDAKILINISMAAKEKIIFNGYGVKQNQKYDAQPHAYAYEDLYLVDENGQKRDDSDEIMASLKDYVKIRYEGDENTKEGQRLYNSYVAPVNSGYYSLTVELSEENSAYTAEPYSLGNMWIYRREINFRADSVTLNVGEEMPETFTYRTTGDGLLDGDTMDSEPILMCDDGNTESAGRYRITVDVNDVDIYNADGDSVRHNYALEGYDAWLTVSDAVKSEVTLSQKAGSQLSKTYDGDGFDGISLIDITKDGTPVTDARLTIKYAGREGTVYAESEAAPVNAGLYTMKAKVASADSQYKSNELSLDIEITKAAAPTLSEQTINEQTVTENTSKTQDITQYLSAGYEVVSFGAVQIEDEDNVLTGTAEVSAQGVLSYTLKAGTTTGTALLTIPLVFRNYEAADMKVKVALTSKTLLTLSQATDVDVNSEYNGNAYALPENVVVCAGIPQDATQQPKLAYVYTLRGDAAPITARHAGLYTVTVTVAEDDENYIAQAPLRIDFEITKKTVNVTAESGDWNKAAAKHPTSSEYPLGCKFDALVSGDSWISSSANYTYTYTADGEVVTLDDTDEAWSALEAGTVITVMPSAAQAPDDYEINYVPGTLTVKDVAGEFYVEDIKPMVYTGKQLKPQVKVYVMKNGKLAELTSKDYKVTYGENKNAGTGTVIITGKGNYDKPIEKEFVIEKASIGNGTENKELGVTLKYTEQSLSGKASKLVTSLKYKKALKEGTDFEVTLTKEDESNAVVKTEGTTPAKTPTGDSAKGVYTLHIEAKENTNYSGYIDKKVYIAGREQLLKNAKITIKTKTLKWDDKDTTDYANYNDKEGGWGGFYLTAGSSKTDTKDFTVSIGKDYLKNNQTGAGIENEESDFFISYTNNDRVGTATITVTGDGENYFGTKSATFKIQGSAFKAGTKDGNIILPTSLTEAESYTGEEIEKAVESLTISGKTVGTGDSAVPATLVKDEDYSVTYKNNVKKGSASVIITANPKSGYSGSIKKSFKITAADLKKAVKSADDGISTNNIVINTEAGGIENGITSIEYKGSAPYSKAGAVIPNLVFKNAAGKELKQGTDYTVKYTYKNKDKNAGSDAVMTLKGKGNYAGTLEVSFKITQADYSSLDISTASVKLGKKAVKPKVTVKDGKKALTVSENDGKDVKIKYYNNEPEKVKAWLEAGAPEGNNDIPAPKVEITINNDNYVQESSEMRTLNIYEDKLGKPLTINWRDTSKKVEFTYNNGEQVKPVISSIEYKNVTYTVRAAGEDYYAYNANNDAVFKITYGANNKTGKKAGSVTIEALRLYGGKYTEKFEIHRKDISIN